MVIIHVADRAVVIRAAVWLRQMANCRRQPGFRSDRIQLVLTNERSLVGKTRMVHRQRATDQLAQMNVGILAQVVVLGIQLIPKLLLNVDLGNETRFQYGKVRWLVSQSYHLL